MHTFTFFIRFEPPISIAGESVVAAMLRLGIAPETPEAVLMDGVPLRRVVTQSVRFESGW